MRLRRRWSNHRDAAPLWLATALAAVLFSALYLRHVMPAGDEYFMGIPPVQELYESAPLVENKDIYQLDTNLYDVYISVLPTEDEAGNTLDLSAFDLHTAMDHSYNPTLNCNIQILPEGQTPDRLLDLNQENATIRVRGNTSRGDPYKNYKVNLNSGTKDFFGQTSLNINKDYHDVTKIGSKLSTDLLTGMDNVAGYRTYFMRLWIRDASLPRWEQEFEYQGMYVEMEPPNKAYLRARGLGEGSSFYKAKNFVFLPGGALRDVDDPEYSQEAFEEVLSIQGGAENHAKLLNLLEAVNDTGRNFTEVFAENFNEDNYLTWLAFNLLMGHEDILNQNFLLYSPADSQTWYFLNWDFDGGLRFGASESQRPESLRGIQKLVMVGLHRRYFQIPGNLEKLDEKMRELLDTGITRDRVTALVEAYRPVLEKTLLQDPDLSLLKYSPEQLSAYLDGLYDGILHNYDVFKASSQYPFSGFVAMPVRNGDGSVQFAWDPFYSLKNGSVSYSVRIYTDYDMRNMVYEITGLRQAHYLLEEGLPDGTYYVLISGVDSEGWEQISLEHVEGWEGEMFYYKDGLLKFTLE